MRQGGKARQRNRARQRRRESTESVKVTHIPYADISISSEVERVISRAQAGEETFVILGSIGFFSTSSRDAWMIDLEDQYALCVAQAGVPLKPEIIETDKNFSVPWSHQFRFIGPTFLIYNPEDGERAILGYPAQDIHNAIQRFCGVQSFPSYGVDDPEFPFPK